MNNLTDYYRIVEKALEELGINPMHARNDGEGMWMINRDDIEIYIDVYQPDKPSQWQYFDQKNPAPVFQVVCPVCQIPQDERRDMFMTELLHLNFHMYHASFSTNDHEKLTTLVYKVPAEGITVEGVLRPVDALSFYAFSLADYFEEKYKVKKISGK